MQNRLHKLIINKRILFCPLSGQPIERIVYASDGNFYDLTNLHDWIARNGNISPITGKAFTFVKNVINLQHFIDTLEHNKEKRLRANLRTESTLLDNINMRLLAPSLTQPVAYFQGLRRRLGHQTKSQLIPVPTDTMIKIIINEEAIKGFRCGITFEIFQNLVLASDGYLYELRALCTSFYKSKALLSPITRETLHYVREIPLLTASINANRWNDGARDPEYDKTPYLAATSGPLGDAPLRYAQIENRLRHLLAPLVDGPIQMAGPQLASLTIMIIEKLVYLLLLLGASYLTQKRMGHRNDNFQDMINATFKNSIGLYNGTRPQVLGLFTELAIASAAALIIVFYIKQIKDTIELARIFPFRQVARNVNNFFHRENLEPVVDIGALEQGLQPPENAAP